MTDRVNLLKGICPGLVLTHELKKRQLSNRELALLINENPQILDAITKGEGQFDTSLALKIERALGIEEGYFMVLRSFYEVRKGEQVPGIRPDLSKIRRGLFWDTDIEKIDWQQQRRAVIRRIFERGNDEEKNEILQFYGQIVIDQFMI